MRLHKADGSGLIDGRTLIIGVVFMMLGFAAFSRHRENVYLQSTPPMERAAHEEFAKQLKEAPNGTFLVYKDGTLASLQNIDRDRRDYRLFVVLGPAVTRSERMVTETAREIENIVTPFDSEWPQLARKFLLGTEVENSTQR